MKKELLELIRDRFTQTSNVAYISLPIIFSVLSSVQDNIHLFNLGIFLFLLAVISLNSIYILVAQKEQDGIFLDVKGNKTKISVDRYPKLHIVAKGGLVVSVFMLISAFFVPGFRNIASPTSTETPTVTLTTAASSEISSATLSPTFTQTTPPTETSTSTATPTITPTFTPTLTATPTTNPMVFRGLDQECLNQTLWTPFYYQGENKIVDSRNCWNLINWGIIPENGNLSLAVTDSGLSQDITRRLYTKIIGDSEMKFTVRIGQFTTNPNFDGILMLGVGNPESVLASGYYIKYTLLGKDNKIYRTVTPNIKTYYEPRSEYALGESQNIIIRITGNQAKIIADGQVLRTQNLSPEERSVFWIVYSLPSINGSLTAEISGFQIYDQR